MKVTGWGNPDQVRIRFARCEGDLLVDVLRELRAEATRVAAETYASPDGRDERTVDNRHDRLRAIEGLLMQLENQSRDPDGRVVLIGDTTVLTNVVQLGGIRAVQQLTEAHDRYHDYPNPRNRDALLSAAATAQALILTLTSVDRVDQPREVPRSRRQAADRRGRPDGARSSPGGHGERHRRRDRARPLDRRQGARSAQA